MKARGPKTDPIDPMSYTMIVSGLLNPFLAILDFFDSYHALATFCKFEKTCKFGIFGNFEAIVVISEKKKFS